MQSNFFPWPIEKVVPVFTQEKDQLIAQGAIDSCWKWLQNKSCYEEYLYNLLDDEDNGVTIIQEMSEIEIDKVAWNCIIPFY